MSTMATAFGKVILLGEHAVVHGVPAIAAGIDRGARASARAAERATLALEKALVTPDDASDLGRAFGALLGELGAPPLEVTLESDLPVGCGLGSSAAMAVAVARAALAAMARADDDELVQRAALAWERIFHGTPSGIDTAAAALGGCIWFEKGRGATPLVVAEPLELAIVVAGPPASTKEMVESVARLKERRPDVVRKALDGIGSLVKNARLAIEAGDRVGLGRLLDLNQMLLAGLHVSSEEIETACRLAREAGALGAKLTGAGGGGAVLALVDQDAGLVLEAWRGAGLSCFSATVATRREPA